MVEKREPKQALVVGLMVALMEEEEDEEGLWWWGWGWGGRCSSAC